MNKVPDATIIQKVTKQLSNRGMQSPCHIAVAVRKGDVTLTGSIQYEHQRIAALHATPRHRWRAPRDGSFEGADESSPKNSHDPKTNNRKNHAGSGRNSPTMEKAAQVIEIAAPTGGNQ